MDNQTEFLKSLEDVLFNGSGVPPYKPNFKGIAEMKGGVLDFKGVTVEELNQRINELAKKARENYWNMSLEWRFARERERRLWKR
jgi:5,10-methenyltetrahydromethanopterin hydrogenase